MIDHGGYNVSDFGRAKAFYTRALGAIDYRLLLEFPAAVTGSVDVAGFGAPPKPDFWIAAGEPNRPPLPIAFRVTSRALVDRFHQEALAAGVRDHGAPGLRPHYHPDYYAAFVLDHDGHNVEAVCHEPA